MKSCPCGKCHCKAKKKSSRRRETRSPFPNLSVTRAAPLCSTSVQLLWNMISSALNVWCDCLAWFSLILLDAKQQRCLKGLHRPCVFARSLPADGQLLHSGSVVEIHPSWSMSRWDDECQLHQSGLLLNVFALLIETRHVAHLLLGLISQLIQGGIFTAGRDVLASRCMTLTGWRNPGTPLTASGNSLGQQRASVTALVPVFHITGNRIQIVARQSEITSTPQIAGSSVKGQIFCV